MAEPTGQVLTPAEYDALPANPRRGFVDPGEEGAYAPAGVSGPGDTVTAVGLDRVSVPVDDLLDDD